jgi:hypothetical protein
MADLSWIKKTVILSLALGAPAIVLLVKTWRIRARTQAVPSRPSFSQWVSIVFIATFLFFCSGS